LVKALTGIRKQKNFYAHAITQNIPMKRLTYISGYLFTLTWITGVLFKMLHMAGATMMLSMGSTGLAFIFFPLLLSTRYKRMVKEVLSERLKRISGRISFLLLVLACVMEIFHIAGAGMLLATSSLFVGLVFLPFFFLGMYKKSLD